MAGQRSDGRGTNPRVIRLSSERLRVRAGDNALAISATDCDGALSFYFPDDALSRIAAPRLASALHYAAHGIRVFPTSYDKAALIKAPAKRATTDEERLRAWWREFPFAGVGVPTGQPLADGYLVVLDVDAGADGGEESWDALIATFGHPPDTPTVLTGAGFHAYFLSDEPLATVDGWRAGIDLKGVSGQVVGAGSGHPSGREYAWELSSPLGALPLARLSAWLPRKAISSRKQPDAFAAVPPQAAAARNRRTNSNYPLVHVVSLQSEASVPRSDVRRERRAGQSASAWARATAKDEQVARAVAPVLGLPQGTPLHCAVLCPLHAERHPSAYLTRGNNGVIVLRCLHLQGTPHEFLTLPAVWHARRTGRIEALDGTQTLLRHIELLGAAGVVTLPEVALETRAPERAEVERLLACCAFVQGNAERVAVSTRTLGAWLGIGHRAARTLLGRLEREGAIRIHRDGRKTLRVDVAARMPLGGAAGLSAASEAQADISSLPKPPSGVQRVIEEDPRSCTCEGPFSPAPGEWCRICRATRPLDDAPPSGERVGSVDSVTIGGE